MKKTVEQINQEQGVFWNAVACPLCASTETTRMNGKPIGKLAADEMASGKVFYFCGTCGAGFFAVPPVQISDEAIMIGNMITLWLEMAYQESHASDVIRLWESPKIGHGGLTKAGRHDEAMIARGRFMGIGYDAMTAGELIKLAIGDRAAFEIQLGISAADGKWESTSGVVV